MKECVVIPNYNNYANQIPQGVLSWEYYCNKYNINLHLLNNNKTLNRNKAIWQCWFDLAPIFESYDRVLMVDLDTIIRWDTPNLFQKLPNKFNCCLHYRLEPQDNIGEFHFNQWEHFTNFTPNTSWYFNTGVLLFNKSHYKIFMEHLPSYYNYYMDQMLEGNTPKPGKRALNAYEQTPVNLVAQQHLTSELRFMSFMYNTLVMHHFNDFSFINEGYIWHFTGGNMGGGAQRPQLMQQTWDIVKENYT